MRTRPRYIRHFIIAMLHGMAFSVLVPYALSSCKDNSINPYKDISLEAFSNFRDSRYTLDIEKVAQLTSQMARADHDTTQTDRTTRRLYRDTFRPVWIDRYGIDSRIDTLLSYLKTVEEIGFTTDAFFVNTIETDATRLKSLDFADKGNDINHTAARLEYLATKAMLRYATGQRYGYTNPFHYLNRLDPAHDDSTKRVTEYRHLFDIPIERPDDAFYANALALRDGESLGRFLRSVQPHDATLEELQRQLGETTSEHRRWLLLSNMERHRWRTKKAEDTNGKKVVVNIPAFMLYAYSADSVMTMKIGCGSTKTKTPLLTSEISRMDLNPLWNIPMSIIKKDVAPHAGDPRYFNARRYFIVERETGKRLDPSIVTAQMLRSGAYRVSQEGGEGNSLGRIIFRFDNKFSVYLHDTSSRRFFNQTVRSVSHGCIRVERPFDLACFLLGDDADEWTLDRIRISMDLEPQTNKGKAYVRDTTRTRKLINSKTINPKVPVFIVYQTLDKNADGRWKEYADIYGFDAVMRRELRPFTKR